MRTDSKMGKFSVTGKLLAMVLCMVFVLAGCGQRGEPAATQAPQADGGNTGTGTITVRDVSKENLKIGFSAAQMDANPVYWVQGMEEAFSVYPNVEFNTFDAGGSVETQVQQIQEMINQDYDAILLHASDTAALASVSTQAEAAGIRVLSVNVGPQSPHSAGIYNDSYNCGVLCANDAAEKLSGGKCVAIGPPVALSATVFGVSGFEDTLAKHEGFTFLEGQAGDWTTENGNEIMRNFLSKYNNDIQVVFCHNDQMAIGAAQAIDAAGLTGKILVYGCDGLPEALSYIAEGKMTGSVYVDNVTMGKSAAQTALYCIASGVDGSKFSQTPIISVAAIVIDKDTVENYMK